MGGGKGGGSAPKPDPQIGKAALENAQLGRDYLAWSKETYGDSMLRQQDIDALTKRVIEQQMGIADEQLGMSREQAALARQVIEQQLGISGRQAELGYEMTEQQIAALRKQLEIADQQFSWAKEDRQRYTDTFIPIEDEFIEEATNYASPERQAQLAAEARADVQRSADMARQQSQRQMASMGVDPRSGRFAGVDRAAEIETALASAGAQNMARTQVRDKGLALKADVANMGRGLPAQSAQATSLGLGAGSSAAGIAGAVVGTAGAAAGTLQGLNTAYNPSIGALGGAAATLGGALGAQAGANQQFMQAGNIIGSGYNMAMQGVSNQANILNQQYQNQLQAWAIQQQNDGGLFGGLGSLAGGLGSLYSSGIFSSKKVKEDKKPVKGALEAVKKMPVEQWKYKDGVEDGGKHIGPYAEDFQKATGLGDGKTIALQDAIGLNMKATQELSEKVDKIAARMPGLGGAKKRKNEKRRAA